MNCLAILVRETRKDLALTQEQMAKKINISNISLCQLENGKEMGSQVIKKCARYFKKTTKEIRSLMLEKKEN